MSYLSYPQLTPTEPLDDGEEEQYYCPLCDEDTYVYWQTWRRGSTCFSHITDSGTEHEWIEEWER